MPCKAFAESGFLCARSLRETMPMRRLLRSMTGRRRTWISLMFLHTCEASSSSKQYLTSRVIASRTLAPGPLPSATPRIAMSRSVTMPISRSPSATGRTPQSHSLMSFAACCSVSFGWANFASRVITSRIFIQASYAHAAAPNSDRRPRLTHLWIDVSTPSQRTPAPRGSRTKIDALAQARFYDLHPARVRPPENGWLPCPIARPRWQRSAPAVAPPLSPSAAGRAGLLGGTPRPVSPIQESLVAPQLDPACRMLSEYPVRPSASGAFSLTIDLGCPTDVMRTVDDIALVHFHGALPPVEVPTTEWRRQLRETCQIPRDRHNGRQP